MANNKKPRKKYTPRAVYHPNLINQMNSFSAFETALERLAETGECMVDEFGCLTFVGSNGTIQSFESTLRVYIHVLEICVLRKLFTLDTTSLSVLQNRMFERNGFDEEEIAQAQEVLKKARILLSRVNTLVVRDILTVVRTAAAMDRQIADPTTLPPQEGLALCYRIAGKLSYEEVVLKDQEYQQLAENNPDDKVITEIRDIYAKYLSVYNSVQNA